MNTQSLFKVLEQICPLSIGFRDALKGELQMELFPKNHSLVQVHSIAHHSWFLEKGFAVAYYFSELKRVVTNFYKPGDIILSPSSFCQQIPSSEMIQLTMDSELLSISFESVNMLFGKFPEANYLARAITAQVHLQCEARMVDLHTLNAQERYFKLLKSYPSIDLNASQDLIASYLNITPQSLSRLRHK